MGRKRTALLIYCTREEAARVRAAAGRERRTISGFVMNAVMARFGQAAELQTEKSGLGVSSSRRPDRKRPHAGISV